MDTHQGRWSVAQWGVLLLGVLLVFAPLARGGNRPLPLLAMELVSIGLVAWLVARPVFMQRLSWAGLLFVAGVFLLPLLQLVPVPFGVASAGSMREAYGGLLTASPSESAWHTVSIIPSQTQAALLTLLPVVAAFLLVVSVRSSDVKRLVGVFLGVVLFQAVLSLMQYGSTDDSLLYMGLDRVGDAGVGTYPNRNHLAGLMEMALPITLALLASAFFGMEHGAPRRHHSRRGGLLRRFKHWFASERLMNRSLLYGTLTLLVILGAVFSRSRTGIGLVIIGLVLTAFMLTRNFGKHFAKHLTAVVAGMAVVLAAAVGLAPVFDRFGMDPLEDERWAIFDASLRGVGEFFPLGSGMGTYPQVMRGFQPDGMGGFVNHAHNDYIEWLFEGGLFAGVLMLLFMVLYLVRWRAVWSVRNWHSLHMMQVGAGVGLFLILLHGLTDYNLRIPANMIYAAFLAGVFFNPGEEEHHHSDQHRRRHSESAVDMAKEIPSTEPVVADAAMAPQSAVPGSNTTTPAAGSAGKRNPFDM